MAISNLNTKGHQILKDELFPERFFRAVFACHAEKEPAETFCHLQKSSSMATVLWGITSSFNLFSLELAGKAN